MVLRCSKKNTFAPCNRLCAPRPHGPLGQQRSWLAYGPVCVQVGMQLGGAVGRRSRVNLAARGQRDAFLREVAKNPELALEGT